MDCIHCDEWGFCAKYSNDAVVWKCKEDADCEGYVEDEDGYDHVLRSYTFGNLDVEDNQ